MLPSTTDEEQLLTQLKQTKLPPILQQLLTQQFIHPLGKIIKKLLNHQALSKNELLQGLQNLTLHQENDPINAIFLESLRLKEESPLENNETLNYFYNHTQHKHCNCPILINFCNPYDGFNRFYPVQLFSSLLLAASGIPCLLHGVYESGPKNGLTVEKLLQYAKKDTQLKPETVKKNLENNNLQWGYLSQQQFCPTLYKLQTLRTAIVKRPLLATIEKFLCPILAKRNILITGYTHPPYRQKSIQLLQSLPCKADFLILRGQEGSSQAPLDRQCPIIGSINNTLSESFCRPENYQLHSQSKIPPQKLDPDDLLKEGLKTLQNQPSILSKNIQYQCLIILHKQLGYTLKESKQLLAKTLETKKAWHLWETL